MRGVFGLFFLSLLLACGDGKDLPPNTNSPTIQGGIGGHGTNQLPSGSGGVNQSVASGISGYSGNSSHGGISGESGFSGSPTNPDGGSSGSSGGGGAKGVITTLRVHYPVASGHFLTIRGNAGGLTWDTGVALNLEPDGVWNFSTDQLLGDLEWKPMLDDMEWARGPNYLAKAGAVIDIYPHFHVTQGVVKLLRKGFSSAKLAAKRDVWAYLPPTYLENDQARFPVLYMQDGQNLFDATLAFGGNEWQVDEAFDEAAETGAIREAIVIGVGNTSERIFEYTPTSDPSYVPSGGGASYLALLTEELKPLVDVELRTLPNPEFTAVMGSSLGGLFSSYAGIEAPLVFGLVGALSPSTWWDDKVLLSLVASIPKKASQALRVYIDCGDSGASQDGLVDTKLLMSQYQAVGYEEGSNFYSVIQQGASHSEIFWAQRFPGAAAFLLGTRPDSSKNLP